MKLYALTLYYLLPENPCNNKHCTVVGDCKKRYITNNI